MSQLWQVWDPQINLFNPSVSGISDAAAASGGVKLEIKLIYKAGIGYSWKLIFSDYKNSWRGAVICKI